MALNSILATLAFLSLGITLWQFIVALRFPLHQRVTAPGDAPPVTLLKPVRGVDAETWHCLESWLNQDYAGPVQILIGVASADDPACEMVRQMIAARPERDLQLVVCGESLGANAKVATLVQLQRRSKHDVLVVSDADVHVPPDFLANAVAPLRDEQVGLVNCFYRLADPTTLPMQWEAIAINADFWSQVLQSQSLKLMDFALGAVMVTTRRRLESIGAFATLVDFLADDYQLGNLIARRGGRIVISPIVVECRESPKNWRETWRHQLRWARTVRVCRPVPYFFSILGNATLWPVLCAWFGSVGPLVEWSRRLEISFQVGSVLVTGLEFEAAIPWAFLLLLLCAAVRLLTAFGLQARLNQSLRHWTYFWLVPIKDILSAMIWALAFLGNAVEWRGQRYRVRRGGKLDKDA